MGMAGFEPACLQGMTQTIKAPTLHPLEFPRLSTGGEAIVAERIHLGLIKGESNLFGLLMSLADGNGRIRTF